MKKAKTSRRFRTIKGLRVGVENWARKLEVKPTQIRIQAMKRKWASCSPIGWISLSAELLRQPRPFQDYVIVHELLHIAIPNHGKLFKCLMTVHLPNWETVRSGRRGSRPSNARLR